MNLCSPYKTRCFLIALLFVTATDLLYATLASTLTIAHGILGVISFLGLCACIWFQSCALNLISASSKTVKELAKGNFEARITHIKEGGSLGGLAHNINSLADNVDAFVREACNSMEAVSKGLYYRKVVETGMPGLFRRSAVAINSVTRATEERIGKFKVTADTFETNVMGIVERVTQSSKELQSASEQMLNTAETTNAQAGIAMNATQQANENVSTVSAAAEELSASIAEIDRRVASAASMAAKAHEEAKATDVLVRSLTDAAKSVGNVVGMITAIAEQTNLLALNATIEAARAGDAGKGFAVVANEVKSLAAQTAKATEDISNQISNMSAATNGAVDAISKISATIEEINRISSDVREAVEEQRSATQDIARTVQQVSSGTQIVQENIGQVSNAAVDTKSASTQVLSSAQDLNGQSTFLHEEVEKFLQTVRAA